MGKSEETGVGGSNATPDSQSESRNNFEAESRLGVILKNLQAQDHDSKTFFVFNFLVFDFPFVKPMF